MTECTQTSFELQAHFSRAVRAEFDGGTMTSDAGGLLLRESERRLPRIQANRVFEVNEVKPDEVE